jgi:RND superfamily putative drug exporter
MSELLYRLGHLSVRRRRSVLAGWVGLLAGLVLLSAVAGGTTAETLSIPGTESQKAADLLAERFPSQSGSDARVVFAAPVGARLTDEPLSDSLRATADALAAAPGVTDVSAALADGTVSPEGDVAYVTVQFAADAADVTSEELDALHAATRSAVDAGIRVEFGGEVIEANGDSHGRTSELIGMGVALVVLVISFGSLIAGGLPLVTALLGVVAAMMGIHVLASVMPMASSGPTLAIMIGLAVGIDYALFIITRHRQNLAEGLPPAEAAARAVATAGGAVVFAGLTVVIALAGLAVVGIPFLTTMGLAAALAVLVAVLIAVTLTPALLGFAGRNIDRWRLGKASTGSAAEAADTFSARWARAVTRRPALGLAGGLIVMLVLALPALDLRLGMLDAGSEPPSTTQRQAYDLLADAFGPGFNGPLTAVVDLSDAADADAALTAVADAARADAGVLAVSTAATNEVGDTAVISVIPRSGPSSTATEQLVHRLRQDVFPSVESSGGTTVSVTGPTAANIDISDKLASALPVFIVVVIGLTAVLLLAAFRSILVPIKAAIAILLSIGSSFGVLVAVFQWGWLKEFVGLEETVPIISFLPLMMFAILFGLSMDYEVFILSRIREGYVRTGDARGSVLSGLTSSARVITAAALIMISVFGSFVLGDEPVIKMFGVGFAVAVLLDATVVRMLIVPATMSLLDRAAWWLPRWLDRALPNLDVEGEHLLDRLEHAPSGIEPGPRQAGEAKPRREDASMISSTIDPGTMNGSVDETSSRCAAMSSAVGRVPRAAHQPLLTPAKARAKRPPSAE